MKDSTLGDRRFHFLAIGIGMLGAVVAAAACVGEDPDVAAREDGGNVPAEAGGASDAGDGKREPDAAIDAAPCDLSKPFDAPVPVEGLSTLGVYEQSARLSRDERTAYVTLSNFNGKEEGGALFRSTRLEHATLRGTEGALSDDLRCGGTDRECRRQDARVRPGW